MDISEVMIQNTTAVASGTLARLSAEDQSERLKWN